MIDIEPPINIFISHDISSMVNLPREEIAQWFNALSITTGDETITLGETLLGKISEEDILIAVNKGWDIA
jgi:hypothetical protein